MDNIKPIAKPRTTFGRAAQTAQRPARAPQPPATPLLAPPPVPQPSLDRPRIIAGSFAVMGRNGVTFLALVAAAAAPERVLYHLIGEDSPLLLALTPLTAISCLLLYAAVFDGAMRDLRGEAVTFGGCLRAALRTPVSAFATIALTVFSVWFLLIVPGIAIATRWAVAAPVAIVEDKTLPDALARSTALTSPCRDQVRALILLLAALGISRAFTMMPLWGMPVEALPEFFFGNWLFPLLLTSFTAAAGAVLYRELVSAPAANEEPAPPRLTGT